jgi:hypothetical protein
MWFWLMLAPVALVLIGVLVLDGRRRERAIARDWELVLTPRGQRRLDRVQAFVNDQLALVGITHERAKEARAAGDMAQAYRLVDVGCLMIGSYAPRMVDALSAWLALSRMASAIAPARPLRPADFRLAQLAHLAQLGRFAHHLMVSTADRFRLRVHMLQRGLRTVAGLALRWRGTAPLPDWKDVEAVHRDVSALRTEALATFKTLLVSLDAERRTSH